MSLRECLQNQRQGASPNLHFHTLPGTQIYTTHIYTKPTVTQHQIYTGPKFTRTHIFTTSTLHNRILHKPKYTQPQNNTKPNSTQIKIYTGPNFTQPWNTLFPVSFCRRSGAATKASPILRFLPHSSALKRTTLLYYNSTFTTYVTPLC